MPAPPPPALLTVNVAHGGVDLGVLAPAGSRVAFGEVRPDGTVTPLGSDVAANPNGGPGGLAKLLRAVQWQCTPTVRHFRATVVEPSGQTIVLDNVKRTPDCADRLAIAAPREVTPGARLHVSVTDRWSLGDLQATVCVSRPGHAAHCRPLAFAPGQRTRAVAADAGARRGLLRIRLRLASARISRTVGVGRAAPRQDLPSLLVLGDSMVQGIDAFLADRLQGVDRVVSDTRPGTGISKAEGTPWSTVAAHQAATHRATASFVFLGVNDGFPMRTPKGTTVACCGAPWVAEYARRAAAIASTLSRHGHARVLWALLPPAKDPRIVPTFTAVNAAITAMADHTPSVSLVHLDSVFGPTFHNAIHGTVVRDPDGLHLSVAGQRLAADAVLDALR